MIDGLDLHAAIRATPAFGGLSDDQIERMLSAATIVLLAPNEALMVQGEPSNTAMLIVSGEAAVFADSEHGEIRLSTLRAPTLVGEIGAFAKLARTATVRALTPMTALSFGRKSLVEVASEIPSFLFDIIGRLGDRIRKVNGAIGLYTHALSALERQEFGPALLEELRNPIPDLADFGETFRRMAEQILLRRQRDDEMASAAIIQRALLPKPVEFAFEVGIDLHAAMTPAREIGGDFFDLVRLEDGRIALGVGDVCGKGVPAALFMGITKTLIRINLREHPDLPAAILKTNAFLTQNNASEQFATIFYVVVDPTTGVFNYCSCGHIPAYVRRANGAVDALSGGGLPVGLFETMKARVHSGTLGSGDILVLFTDGLTEAVNSLMQEFGETRLLEVLSEQHEDGANAWVSRLESRVREFAAGQAQSDDLTCVVLKL